MPKARNQVIAGDFKGKEVKYTQRRIWISGFLRDITLNGNTVASYDLINKETKKDRAGAIRSGLVFGAGGLFAHAALSDGIGIYSVAIQFKDGKSCLIEIDASAYQTLNKTCFRTAFAAPEPVSQPIQQPMPQAIPVTQPTSQPMPIPQTVPVSTSGLTSALSDGSFFCTQCGNRVPAGSKFCNACGSPIMPPNIPQQSVEKAKLQTDITVTTDDLQLTEQIADLSQSGAHPLNEETADTPVGNNDTESTNTPAGDPSILVVAGKTFDLAKIYDEAKGKKFRMESKIEESFTMKEIFRRSTEDDRRISNAVSEYIKLRKSQE
jgi:hypothetical protein